MKWSAFTLSVGFYAVQVKVKEEEKAAHLHSQVH
jgi:hypothetical protein